MDAVRDAVVKRNAAIFRDGADALRAVFVGEHDEAVQQVQPRTFTRQLPGGAGLAPLLDRQAPSPPLPTPAAHCRCPPPLVDGLHGRLAEDHASGVLGRLDRPV